MIAKFPIDITSADSAQLPWEGWHSKESLDDEEI